MEAIASKNENLLNIITTCSIFTLFPDMKGNNCNMHEEIVQQLFPQSYEYKIMSDMSNSNLSTFKVKLRVNVKT